MFGKLACRGRATFVAALFALFAGPAAAPAQVVISVSSATVAAGGSGFVDVRLSTTTSIQVTGMGLALNLPAGAGVRFTAIDFPTPANQYLFAGNSFDQANGLPLGSVSADALRVTGNDLANAGAALLPANGSALLARLLFATNANAPLGAVVVSIDTQFTGLTNNANPPAAIPYTPQNGVIQVVPEPSALALTGMVAAWVVWRKRRQGKGAGDGSREVVDQSDLALALRSFGRCL